MPKNLNNDAHINKLKRENIILKIVCLIAAGIILILASFLNMTNPNDPYVVSAAKNITQLCNDRYDRYTPDNIGYNKPIYKTKCIYEEATIYVNDRVPYSYQKLNDTQFPWIKRYFKYELFSSFDYQYNENILIGKTPAVCSDMATVLCSILRNLHLKCDLITQTDIKFTGINNGHMYIKGDIGNETIYCDPTAGYCYGGDNE